MAELVYRQFRRRGEGYDAGVRENVVDPSLRAWILSIFSTTITADTIVACHYDVEHEKVFRLQDRRLARGLAREAIGRYHLLRPVSGHFVAA